MKINRKRPWLKKLLSTWYAEGTYNQTSTPGEENNNKEKENHHYPNIRVVSIQDKGTHKKKERKKKGGWTSKLNQTHCNTTFQ